MSITNEVNIADKLKADKMWNEANFAESAKLYYSAATYAFNVLNNIPLAKKLIVQENLAKLLVAGGFSSEKINNLLKAIDDLILHGLDDRLKNKFKPYKDYFSIILDYKNENKKNLETHKLILTDKLSLDSLTEYESLSLILIELALTRQNFKEGKGGPHILNKLSLKLTNIIKKSKLQDDFKRKINEVAIDIAEDSDLSKKKATIESIFNDLTIVSPGIIIHTLKQMFSDFTIDIVHEQINHDKKRYSPGTKTFNYILIYGNSLLILIYLILVNKNFGPIGGLIVFIIAAILSKKGIPKFLSTNKIFLIIQILISLFFMFLIFKLYLKDFSKLQLN